MRSFSPATTIPFRVSGEFFLKGHRPVVSLRIYNVLAQLVAIPILRGTGKALDSLALSCPTTMGCRSEEHTSELQSHSDLVCRLLLEKKKKKNMNNNQQTRTTNNTEQNAQKHTLYRKYRSRDVI